jgi:D-sedoheptulose 7-phosphate isomerase
MEGVLEQRVADAYLHREGVVRSFFDREAPRLARACHDMARRFHRGGRILAFGSGSAATDAQHISVEFVHPVIVGKRALPAIAIPNDGPSLLGLAVEDPLSIFVRPLSVLGAPEDIAIGLSPSAGDPGTGAVAAGLKEARARGMLTIGLSGPLPSAGAGLAGSEPDWLFLCEDDDLFVVQEVHETLYHVLWELVHVFFEHRGLLEGDATGSRHDVGRSSFLYPFLSGTETGLDDVLRQVEENIRGKAADVVGIRAQQPPRAAVLVAAARLLAERFEAGGKVLAFGNGGSATDAQDFVTDLIAPPSGMRPLPAISLTNEEAVITAVANDVGFENVFARQVIAYGKPGDVAVGISTSGGSRNLLSAFEESRRRQLATLALVGYGGGPTVQQGLADHALVVDYDYIPRIQEAQATQYHVLRRLVGDLLTP